MAGLSGLQLFNYLTFTSDFNALNNRYYSICLLLVPACFYYFSRFVLFPNLKAKIIHLVHLLLALLGLFLPIVVIPPLAFLIGSAYCLWFIHLVLKLRHQQSRFIVERFFFGMFALMAIGALVLGLMIPYIDRVIFYFVYSNSISLAMLSVTTAIIIFPEKLTDIQRVAESTYIKSKLSEVDVKAVRKGLEVLVSQENVYQNEQLSIRLMAEMLNLSAHLLSELINTQYGYGFSQFIRINRIEQAKPH